MLSKLEKPKMATSKPPVRLRGTGEGPGKGLPKVLENLLVQLIDEKELTHWNVHGVEEIITVYMRFVPPGYVEDERPPSPGEERESFFSKWRRKQRHPRYSDEDDDEGPGGRRGDGGRDGAKGRGRRREKDKDGRNQRGGSVPGEYMDCGTWDGENVWEYGKPRSRSESVPPTGCCGRSKSRNVPRKFPWRRKVSHKEEEDGEDDYSNWEYYNFAQDIEPLLKSSPKDKKEQDVSDVVVAGQPDDLTAREALLLWSRRTVEGYPGVKVKDFSKSWRDGRAFLSIIHRHRPDLVDFRQIRNQEPKDNLKMAFDIAEKEFGVTPLLDPEDVDVASPDEKSLITYVSSLYDVFPEVPSVEQSLKDNERQLKYEEYKDLANSLHTWVKDATNIMQDRNFPQTLIEMKSLLAEFNRFRIEDVPPRLQDKQRLAHIFDELQALSADAGQFSLEDHLRVENLHRLWERFTMAAQEKDMAIQAEITRLERLQRLAEKVHRDCKTCEDHLEDIDRRIIEEEQRIDRVPPQETRRSVDAIQRALKMVGDNIQHMFSDVQALKEGRYHQSEQMHRRVYRIQQRWASLNSSLDNELLSRISATTYEESPLMSRRADSRHGPQLESNAAFRNIQDCLQWIQNKQIELEGSGFGSDLETSREALDRHKYTHQQIIEFKSEVDACIAAKKSMSSEEQKLYQQYISKVEVAYSLLMQTSSRRMKNLESLVDFMQLATAELIWLNEREEQEVARDWSAQGMDLRQIKQTYERGFPGAKGVMSELEGRESHFNKVQDRGEALVMERHPAAKTVEAYMAAMQTQWAWLLQLSNCLETHLRHAQQYHQFYEDAESCESWIQQQSDQLNTYYNKSTVGLDDGERLIREIQELRDRINGHQMVVDDLSDRSHHIVPVKERGSTSMRTRKVTALCAYKQQLGMSITKNEECVLLDNSQKTKWTVRNSSGQEGLVPAACFVISPPDHQVVQYANNVHSKFEDLKKLWMQRQRHLRKHMIFATIKVVKQWDIEEFQTRGLSQAAAIMKALNDDTEKLVADYGVEAYTDTDIQHLQREMDDCNRIYAQLCARHKDEEQGAPGRSLTDNLDQLKRRLEQLNQTLQTRLQEALPRDLPQVETMVLNHKDFEHKLQQHEGEVESTQAQYQRLSPTRRTQQVEARLTAVVETWDTLWAQSHIYVERLKSVEIILSSLDELTATLSEHEQMLTSHDTLSSNNDTLNGTRMDLQELEASLQGLQANINQLNIDMMAIKQLVARSRQGVVRSHPDVQKLESEVDEVTARWENLCIQAAERLKNVDTSIDLLSIYQNGIARESTYLSNMQHQTRELSPIPRDIHNSQDLVDSTMKLYKELKEHRPQIEDLNKTGGKFIKESKMYEKKLAQYRESLEGTQPSYDNTRVKRPRIQSGAENVKVELESVNRQYMELLAELNQRLRTLKDMHDRAGVYFPHHVEDVIPRFRTYRSEMRTLDDDEDLMDWDRLSSADSIDSQSSFQSKMVLIPPSQQHAGAFETTAQKTSKRITQITRGGSTSREEEVHQIQTVSPESLKAISVTSAPSKKRVVSPSRHNVTSISVEGHESIPKNVQSVITVKTESTVPKGQVLYVTALSHPETGKKMSLEQAIENGLLDVRFGMFKDPRTGKKMTLSEAARLGYIDKDVVTTLQQKCGIRDPSTRRELTILEAMQKGLYDPLSGKVKNPRTGESLSLREACDRGLVTPEAVSTLSYFSISTSATSQSQGYYDVQNMDATAVALSITDALEKGLYDSRTGKFKDPISQEEMSLDQALHRRLIQDTVREIVHPVTGEKLNLREAVAQEVIDPRTGHFIDPRSGRRMSLTEAHEKHLIEKSLSLHGALTEGLMDTEGKIKDFRTGKKQTLMEAIESGVLDTDIRCLLDPRTNELLSLTEALQRGLISSSGAFVDPDSGRELSIHAAINRGLAQVINQEVTVATRGITDTVTNEKLTLAEAIQRGFIDPVSGLYIDKRTGRRMSIEEADRQGLIDTELADQLNSDSGLTDITGSHLSVLEALKRDMLDAKMGYVTEPTTGTTISIQDAVNTGYLKANDAQKLLELTSAIMSTTTITTKIEQSAQLEKAPKAISVTEAVRKGLINEDDSTFTDPATGRTISLEEAIQLGFIRLSTEWPEPDSLNTTMDSTFSEQDAAVPTKRVLIPTREVTPEGPRQIMTATTKAGPIVTSTPVPSVTTPAAEEHVRSEEADSYERDIEGGKEKVQWSETREFHAKQTEQGIEAVSVQDAKMTQISTTGSTSTLGDIKLPLSVAEALSLNLLDPKVGTFNDPTTGNKIPIGQAMDKNLLTSQSATFNHPVTKKKKVPTATLR